MTARADAVGRGRLSFVLPIALSGTGRDEDDLRRARLLWKTMDRFCHKHDIARLLVVTPGRDVAAVTGAAAEFRGALKIEVVNEFELCPEFAAEPATFNKWPRPNTGWFRQQLIKLAAHAHVDTGFYMAIDADVLFVRPFGYDTLVREGRGIAGVMTASDIARLFSGDATAHELHVRRQRVKQAERVLAMNRPETLAGRWYCETPVLLDRGIAAAMAAHVEQHHAAPWRDTLLARLPWTEYSLYFLFAEATGLLERHHHISGMDAVLRMSQSLWSTPEKYRNGRGLADWNPAEVFDARREGVEVVIQSYLGYPVDTIYKAVAPYID